jgi:hypothetical protein
MTRSPQGQVVDVIPLQTPARIVWETLRGIRASFPGWHVWYSIDSATWNAHRKGQEPYFGSVPDGEPVFMVSSSSAAHLRSLLEAQTLSDMAREFPAWRIRRTGSGGWCASARGRCGVWLVQSPTESPLRETLRAMTQHGQRACTPRLDHST